MKVWAYRSPSGTRMRIQDEPTQLPWHGAEFRTGDLPDELWDRLCTVDDGVELERAHQDAWRLLSPG